MKKALLVAINSRFSHTNLAVRSITGYVNSHKSPHENYDISFLECTIAQPLLEILRTIAEVKPTMVLFSVYIWNSPQVWSIVAELKKILPSILIGAGGPEAGYRSDELFEKIPELDFIMQGEGEQTILEIMETPHISTETLTKIPGVFTRLGFGGERPLLPDLSELPFPYPEIQNPDFTEQDTRIYYYESSRGCPFNCAYCMSSIDKRVRFMPLEKTFQDIQRFLDAHIKLVKFVDRTFNLNTSRYIAIWDYICTHHNGYTMFHFEIATQQLDEQALDYIQSVPKGIMQFEIGVQSIHEKTLAAVGRPAKIEVLAEKIRRVPKTIHSHLDLIAGLPYETLTEFAKSFDYTIGLYPDMLQLGFLKVLSGTTMEIYAKNNNYQWLSQPPYEVLSTPDLPYEDLLFLKDIELVLDIYNNSGNFKSTIHFIQSIVSPKKGMFAFFSSMVHWLHNQFPGEFYLPRKTGTWFQLFSDFMSTQKYQLDFSSEQIDVFFELLRFDFLSLGKPGAIPQWCNRSYNKDAHHKALLTYTDMTSTRESYSYSEYEEFAVNPLSGSAEKVGILFLYPKPKSGVRNQEVQFHLCPILLETYPEHNQ